MAAVASREHRSAKGRSAVTPGLVYMNGDIGKLAPGAVAYQATADSHGAVAPVAAAPPTPQSLDYAVMNGAAAAAAAAGELMLDTSTVTALEPLPQLAMGMGGPVGYAPIEIAPLQDVPQPPQPPANQMSEHAASNLTLPQLKQLLSSQLEYYFSR